MVLKRFSVSYVEVIENNKTISSCYYDGFSKKDMHYGTIDSDRRRQIATPEIFHKLIMDVVLSKVVPVEGNKVTKMSLVLIDGYDSCYTTATSASGLKVFVCFTKVSVPKILPIKLLSQLKQDTIHFTTDEQLSHRVGEIMDQFHEELADYYRETTNRDINDTTEADIQDVIKMMNDNIDKFLQRQERISLLVDKTSQLNENSHAFKRRTAQLKRKMWWHRMKNITLLLFAAILSIGVIVIFYYVY